MNINNRLERRGTIKSESGIFHVCSDSSVILCRKKDHVSGQSIRALS
jgi:hypothetical protein